MAGKDADGAVAPAAPSDESEHQEYDETVEEGSNDNMRRRSKRRDSVRSRVSELWDDVRDEIPFVHHHHHTVFAESPNVEHHHHYLVIASKSVIRAASLIGWNALLMLISEIVIEFLILFDILPYIPFRLDFFALTTLSALLGYQTLIGTATKELDVTRNSLIVAGFVETFLIVGDIFFLVKVDTANDLTVFFIRFPFLVLTSLNLVLVCYMYTKLHLTFRPDWKRLWGVLLLRDNIHVEDDEDDKVPGNNASAELTEAADLEQNKSSK